MAHVRSVTRSTVAHRQLEGGGFEVRRPIPSPGLSYLDPFLLLDEMGPSNHGPGEAKGAPDHPHRGFETVTYLLDGEMEHEDSAGNRGIIAAGDVQWMTAGSGVVHSEMPSRRIREEGGRMHGFQLWVNLPARDKMMAPRYQEVPSRNIPVATSPDGMASARIIAGEAFGVRSVIDTRIPIWYQDWTVGPGARVSLPIPHDMALYLYVFSGVLSTGDPAETLQEGRVGVLEGGDELWMACAGDAPSPARVLLLAAKPLREPVARYGPFVMNTEAQIREAIADFQQGRMGHIAR